MADHHERRLLIFTRAPEAGRVKTRLIPTLGAEAAAALHVRLLDRALCTALDAEVAPVELWCAPDATHPHFERLRQRWPQIALRAQCEGDLGLRMATALADALSEDRHAVLIGSDCPELSVADLEQAFTSLERGMDAVLGPAQDGGYVLIGLSRGMPARSKSRRLMLFEALFEGVDWGTSKVSTQTRERLHAAGMRWDELPARADVDRPEDLTRLPAQLLGATDRLVKR
ncbi:MAG: TIGR04282 family arsenosugar biosynthesis glycosyltransferase [Ectothiorhodospiraceae bacterium]|nr:TIGR04282 family arsenosugar biosynthesis glycosyltransferase [Ectothiorhodospiraceae bacterium]